MVCTGSWPSDISMPGLHALQGLAEGYLLKGARGTTFSRKDISPQAQLEGIRVLLGKQEGLHASN